METPKLEGRRTLRTAAEYAEKSWFAEAAYCPDSARVDYPRNVGENEFGTSLDPEWPGFRLFCFNCGPVAQLGARFHGMEEVVGSIPTRSTIFNYLQILRFSAWCHLVSQGKHFRFH